MGPHCSRQRREERVSRHTIRAAVEGVADAKLKQATIAVLVGILEEAKVADLAIVEEAGTVVAVDDQTVTLVAWPVGVLMPKIGENLTPTLEVSECENCRRQSTLIGQQHNAIRQLTSLVRSLTRLVELYVGATEVVSPVEACLTRAGGDDGART